MKMKLVFSALLMLSINAFANERGNGGNAVVCRNKNGSIRTAELLDIYEGKVLDGLKYSPLKGTIDEKYESIIKDIYGSEIDMINFNSVKEIFTMLPSGVGLEPINDSLQIITPKDCKIEQVANYYSQTKLYIVSDIYNKFSKLDKLGLLLHEAFYSLDRSWIFGDQSIDSRHVRRSVAYILSTGFKIEPIADGADPYSDLTCSTDFQTQPVGKRLKSTSFYAINLGNGKWRFQFTRLNGHVMLSKKYADFHFQEGAFPKETDDGTGVSNFMSAPLISKIGESEPLVVGLHNTAPNESKVFMTLKWIGSDPGEVLQDVKFVCIWPLNYH